MPNLTPAPLSEADYEAIESAVMETSRGRWFLAEFARRNRHADTTMLLKALERIEGAVTGERSVSAVDRIRFDLVEMANAIARTKAEVAAIKPEAEHQGRFGKASEELDCVVQTTEAATSDILACAERIQELAWTMREQGLAPELCDLIDARATEIYTACTFQDLTGQRTRKVIGVLRYLEGRINAMIEIWGLGAPGAATKPDHLAEVTLLHGPAAPGEGLDQADVDIVMGPAVAVTLAPADDYPAFLDGDDMIPADDAPAPELKLVSPPPRDAVPMPAPARTRDDPLAPIVALSADEKIALFS